MVKILGTNNGNLLWGPYYFSGISQYLFGQNNKVAPLSPKHFS